MHQSHTFYVLRMQGELHASMAQGTGVKAVTYTLERFKLAAQWEVDHPVLDIEIGYVLLELVGLKSRTYVKPQQ